MKHKTNWLLAAALASVGALAHAEDGLIRVPLGGEAGVVTNGLVINASGNTVPYGPPSEASGGKSGGSSGGSGVATDYLVGHVVRNWYGIRVTFEPTVGPCVGRGGVPLLNWNTESGPGGTVVSSYLGLASMGTESVYDPNTDTYPDVPVTQYFQMADEAVSASIEMYEANVDFCVPATQEELNVAMTMAEPDSFYFSRARGYTQSTSNGDANPGPWFWLRYLTINLPTAATSSITIVSPFIQFTNGNGVLSRSATYIMNTVTAPTVDDYLWSSGSFTLAFPFKNSAGQLDFTSVTYSPAAAP